MFVVKVHEMVRAEIAKRMQSISGRICAGRPADFAEYRQLVGRLQGCEDALQVLDEVFAKLHNDEEGD